MPWPAWPAVVGNESASPVKRFKETVFAPFRRARSPEHRGHSEENLKRFSLALGREHEALCPCRREAKGKRPSTPPMRDRAEDYEYVRGLTTPTKEGGLRRAGSGSIRFEGIQRTHRVVAILRRQLVRGVWGGRRCEPPGAAIVPFSSLHYNCHRGGSPVGGDLLGQWWLSGSDREWGSGRWPAGWHRRVSSRWCWRRGWIWRGR